MTGARIPATRIRVWATGCFLVIIKWIADLEVIAWLQNKS
jgi:hypothetical protein